MHEKVGLAEFKAFLRYRGVSQREMADVIGVSLSTFNMKINGSDKASDFTVSEIIAMGEYLDLTADQLLRCFFPQFLA